MRKIKIILVCAACLLFVASTATAQKAKNTMTNADVVEMVKAGLSESTIVLAIQQSEPNFDTSTKALIELKTQGVSQKVMDAMLQAQPTKSVPQTKTDNTNAIASKDIGSLRVVLKSVLPMNLPNKRQGIRCTLEITNRETQNPVVVAMNAIAGNGIQIGNTLRTTLVDDQGTGWKLYGQNISGMSVVGVGRKGPNLIFDNKGLYHPTEIAALLKKQDDLGSNSATERNGSNSYTYQFIFGSMTQIPPGQSVAITMDLVQEDRDTSSVRAPKFFQFNSEIVVGVVGTDSKKSYSLHNLIFDRVNISSSAITATVTTTKDIGSLRVVLKSVLPVKLKDEDGQSMNGIKCFFDFINLEAQSSLVVAAHAEIGMDQRSAWTRFVGDVLRTTLVDDRSTVWRLNASGLTGLGIVSVGNDDETGYPLSPVEIVRVLQLWDETGSNLYPRSDLPFVYGATTQILPGQRVPVVMNFVQYADETTLGTSPNFFELAGEIVVGIVKADAKKSYTLYNLTFDRVSLPSK